jgi:hypothetical protein
VSACSSATFTGSSGKREGIVPPSPTPAQPSPGGESLTFTCGGPATQSVSAHAGDQINVSGQLCPAVTGQAAVLFVVDFSGSMGRHRDHANSPFVAGNDPQVNGSCGRLKAAQAVLAQLSQQSGQGQSSVQVGFVPFASDVLQSRVAPLMSLAQFQQIADANHFCQYVVQDSADVQGNPGAIDGSSDGVTSATNYQAAFQAADQLLQPVAGNKTVFFISDGEPTVPGDGSTASNEAVTAAVNAGAALRQDVQGLTLNGLLLQNTELGAQAQQILAEVAGSADRVRIAASADQLATQILQFSGGDLDLSSAKATLSLAGAPAVALGLKSFTKTASGVFSWAADAFTAAFDQPTVITVSAVTTTGQAVQTSVTLQTTRL